jgi:hypothetical protein
MHEEPVSFYNQYEKDVSMGLPSTQKSEEMVAVGKPPAPKIRSPDIGVPRFHFRTRRMLATWSCECFIQYLMFKTRIIFVVWFCEYFVQCLLFRTRRMFTTNILLILKRRYWMKHSQKQTTNILLILKRRCWMKN